MTPEQRQLLIRALAEGNLALAESLHSAISGRKVILRTLMDYLNFFNAIDENGNPIDREAQMTAGELEVEYAEPLLSILLELEEKNPESIYEDKEDKPISEQSASI